MRSIRNCLACGMFMVRTVIPPSSTDATPKLTLRLSCARDGVLDGGGTEERPVVLKEYLSRSPHEDCVEPAMEFDGLIKEGEELLMAFLRGRVKEFTIGASPEVAKAFRHVQLTLGD